MENVPEQSQCTMQGIFSLEGKMLFVFIEAGIVCYLDHHQH